MHSLICSRLSGTASEPKFTPPPSSGQKGGSHQFLARPLISCASHPSSTQDDQRHFNPLLREGLYASVLLQMQSIACLLSNSIPSSMSHQSIRHRRIASDVAISSLPCFVQIDCTIVQQVRLPGATDTAIACLVPSVLRVLGSAPYRSQAHIAPLLASTASRQSLPRPRYPYRFTCSRVECGVVAGSLRRGGLLCSLRLVFCLPFSAFGDMNRGLFFLYKVRSPTQLPSGSLKPASPIYTTILRKIVQASFFNTSVIF